MSPILQCLFSFQLCIKRQCAVPETFVNTPEFCRVCQGRFLIIDYLDILYGGKPSCFPSSGEVRTFRSSSYQNETKGKHRTRYYTSQHMKHVSILETSYNIIRQQIPLS